MLSSRNILTIISGFLLLFATACDSDDPGPDYTGESVEYTMQARGGSSVTGTVTFQEIQGGATQITMELSGTPEGGDHPAHIHFNSAAEGGDIAISLTNVNGTDGRSLTVVEQDNDGNVVTYDELLNYDGYINVHLSPQDLTVVSQTDIGANALTGNSMTYALNAVNNSGVSGEVIFYERKNGNTLGVLDLSGTPQDGMHPAHVHDNSASEGGGIAISFNMVDGATGMSRTHIEAKDGGMAISYDDLMSYDGYVNVHLSSDDLSVVAQGNIGSNASGQNNSGGGYTY